MRKGLTTCIFLCAAGAAPAQDAAGAILFESCRVCHGPGAGDGTIPVLDGRPRAEVLAKLTAFTGADGASTIMHRFVAGLTPTEVEAIASYISGLEGGAR